MNACSAVSIEGGTSHGIVVTAPAASLTLRRSQVRNRGGHGVPPEVVQREGSAVLSYVRTISNWAPNSQPASLYLVLFQKRL